MSDDVGTGASLPLKKGVLQDPSVAVEDLQGAAPISSKTCRCAIVVPGLREIGQKDSSSL